MRRPVVVASVAILVALSGCTSTPTARPLGGSTVPSEDSGSSPSTGATDSRPSPSASATRSGPTLGSGVALPACTPGAPKASQTATFVASGYAWALDSSGTDLTCLFGVEDSGPFLWGPLGDRVLLGGLEVRGVDGGPSLAASGTTYATIAWSRPTGKSIVYAPIADTTLEKVLIDGSPSQHVTPLPSVRYLSVAYHPSGEAYAFALEREGGQSISMSTNTGKTPVQLVFSNIGTTFGAIAFEADGKHLLYAAQHADNHGEVHRIDVTDTTKAPVAYEGAVGSKILDIQPGQETGTFAWTTGSSCEDGIAMAQSPAGTVRLLPNETGPNRAVGWLSATQVLVASGACAGRLDLSAVDVATGSIVRLVSGVSAAAVRTPVPTPPAPLPAAVATLGSGFS